jgi:hypothetical protein
MPGRLKSSKTRVTSLALPFSIIGSRVIERFADPADSFGPHTALPCFCASDARK